MKKIGSGFVCVVLVAFFACSESKVASVEQSNKAEQVEKKEEQVLEETSDRIVPEALLANEKRTVEDYYLYIPNDGYFNCEFNKNPTVEFRRKNIVKKNIKNGYLYASDSKDFSLEVALFKDKVNNRDVVGVFSRGCNIGGQCPPQYDFWTIVNNKWESIGYEVFNADKIVDQIESEKGIMIGFALPEFGTDIKVVNCDDDKLPAYVVKWEGGIFNFVTTSKNN